LDYTTATITLTRAAGLDASRQLADKDAHPYTAATGDLLITGPTGTNVGDLLVTWRTDSVRP
jgi:hydroxypyruvate reductase